jgi:hypothetical protein
MVNNVEIREAFRNMVGVRPDPSLPLIPKSIRESTSGYYLGEGHSNMTSLETIFYCSNELDNYKLLEEKVDDYIHGRSYKKGDIVAHNGTFYVKRTTDGSNDLIDYLLNYDPNDESSDGDWEETSVFGEFLRKKLLSNAVAAVKAVLQYNRLGQVTSKRILDTNALYAGIGYIKNQIVKRNRFCGIRFRVKAENTIFKIHKLATQFSEVQSDIPIYLYKDGMVDPIMTWTVSQTKRGEMVVHNIQEFSDTDGFSLGLGVYKLGYYEKDLVGNAVEKQISMFDFHCNYCDPLTAKIIHKNRQHVEIRPFYVEEDGLEAGLEQWDNTKEVYRINNRDYVKTNWGINAWISLECDLTEVFLSHKSVFEDVYWEMLNYSLLEEVALTKRANGTANALRNITLQIGGNAKVYNQDKGPKILLIDAKEVVNKAIIACATDFAGIDSACMPSIVGKKPIKISGLL